MNEWMKWIIVFEVSVKVFESVNSTIELKTKLFSCIDLIVIEHLRYTRSNSRYWAISERNSGRPVFMNLYSS